MEPRFEVQIALNRPAIKAYFRLIMRTKMKSLTIVMPIVFLFFLALIVFKLSSGDFDVLHLVSVLVGLLIFTVAFPTILYHSLSKSVTDKNAINVYSFLADSFTVVTPAEKLSSQYSVFHEMIEDAAYYYLFLPNGTAHVFGKSDFTTGSPDDFRVFIEEKTGKKVKFIR